MRSFATSVVMLTAGVLAAARVAVGMAVAGRAEEFDGEADDLFVAIVWTCGVAGVCGEALNVAATWVNCVSSAALVAVAAGSGAGGPGERLQATRVRRITINVQRHLPAPRHARPSTVATPSISMSNTRSHLDSPSLYLRVRWRNMGE
jgi:hypothetical protein